MTFGHEALVDIAKLVNIPFEALQLPGVVTVTNIVKRDVTFQIKLRRDARFAQIVKRDAEF